MSVLVNQLALPLLIGALLFQAQHDHQRTIERQPFALLARRVVTTLDHLGQPLPPADREALERALTSDDERQAVEEAAAILDRHALVHVHINPESRVKVTPGAAAPALIAAGTRVFLVKVENEAGVTAPLRVSSPQSGKVSVSSWAGNNTPEPARTITPAVIAARWADITFHDKPPMTERLSGLPLEYRVLEVYSRDAGRRAAELTFDVGQGTQDIGFRSDIAIVFDAAPARVVTLRVEDERGRPAMARLIVRDAAGRLHPAPSKRLAPDLPFQPQIYRADGESLRLPDGEFTFKYTGGPEYLDRTVTVQVSDKGPDEVWLKLERWIDPAASGWYSGDHHVHAAGCSHYQDPTAGIAPADVFRQIRGESLNVGSVLTWGPCYYHQKRYFSGRDHELSSEDTLLHYDLEISGFPSSHAGHIVLLGLREQEYPGTSRLEDWPSWTLPILRWARQQGAVTGYAHSGWGLEIQDRRIPSPEVPAFDGIGANEFLVTVTHPDAVDFISAVDTPWPWELNIWYHVLNAGFRTRISGETDFPCIYDDRVGLGRTYAKLETLTYRNFLDAIRSGRSYVSDGRSHLMDFAVDGIEVGTGDGTVTTETPSVTATVRVSARLDESPDPELAARPADERPYWDLERARMPGTRDVSVEFLVNGRVAATRRVTADGRPHELRVPLTIDRSAWVAARILPSSHTNPIFVLLNGEPIRPLRSSARWCLEGVDRCWRQKAPQIRDAERPAAEAAYEHARRVYRRLIEEGVDE